MLAPPPSIPLSSTRSTEDVARPMSSEEMLAHQLDLHRRIQQQMQMQREMSLQIGQCRTSFVTSATTQSVAKAPKVSVPRVDPDLSDNVFDMLDDLILVPERKSLSNLMDVEAEPVSGRDSLADIIESLDMDLDDFELDVDGRQVLTEHHKVDAGWSVDEDQDLFEDLDLSEFDDDLYESSNGFMDVAVDDDDDEHQLLPPSPFTVLNDNRRERLFSSDTGASIFSNHGSLSQLNITGNVCTLVWEHGLLGIRLRMSQSRMVPAVSKITGRSSIFGIHLIATGDLLVDIDGRSTRDMEFLEAVNYLKQVKKPCKLIFRRLSADPMAVKPIQPPVQSLIAVKLAKKFDELAVAEEEKVLTTPTVKLDEKYEVKWFEGPLGISLIASKDAPYPLVTRITGKNRSPQVQDVQPGHFLVQIGTFNAADGNFNTAIKYLQKVNKPVSLYFCPGNKNSTLRPEAGPDEYDQVWEKKQPLCFTVRPDGFGRIMVADVGSAKSVKTKAKTLAGFSSTVVSGHYIIWINDDSVLGMTFHESLLKLRTAKRPLLIRFKKSPPEHPVLEPPTTPIDIATGSTAKPRSFNPLKKIATLGSFAKENSINQRNVIFSDSFSDISKRLPMDTPNATTATTTISPPRQQQLDLLDVRQSESLPPTSSSKVILLESLSSRKGLAPKSTPDSTNNQPNSSASSVQHESSLLHGNLNGQPVSSGSETTNGISNIAVQSQSSTIVDEYDVIWPEGIALGLTLRVHPTTRFPVVARVTGTSNLRNIEHVTAGDILFSANGIPIIPQVKFKQTLENLSKIPKPATLRFRKASTPIATVGVELTTKVMERHDSMLPRGPPLRANELEVIWRENTNLGLVFSSEGDVPRVTKVDTESGGLSVAIVHVGDALTSIGSMDITRLTFHTSMATLRATKRPVVLRFRRR